jgi:hypothetical protein
MFETLRRFVGITSSRVAFRKSDDPLIAFAEPLPPSSAVLLILPSGMADATPLTPLLERLAGRFDERLITVVTSGPQYKVERMLPHARVVPIGPDEISVWFLPSRNLMAGIMNRKYALAVDMNLDNNLPSGYICRASGARIRLGFASPHADLFYNFQVRLDPASPRGQALGRLMECLRMFFP